MKNYTVRTIPESNRNMIETEPRSTPIAHIYMTSQIFWPRTVASIKEVCQSISLSQTSTLIEIMRSYVFHVSIKYRP